MSNSINENNIQILIVEDEAIIAENIKIMLEDFGYKISGICYNYASALSALEQNEFDILLTDINLGHGTENQSGIQIVAHLKAIKNCPVIFLTAFSDKDTVKKAASLKPSAYLVKPVNPASLYASLQIAFENFKNENSSNINTNNSEKLEYFFIKHGNKMVKLLWKDVYHLEAIKNYVKIKTPEYPSGVLLRSSLQNLLNEMLPLQYKNQFIKINRSEAVDKSIVRTISPGQIETKFGSFKTTNELRSEDFL